MKKQSNKTPSAIKCEKPSNYVKIWEDFKYFDMGNTGITDVVFAVFPIASIVNFIIVLLWCVFYFFFIESGIVDGPTQSDPRWLWVFILPFIIIFSCSLLLFLCVKLLHYCLKFLMCLVSYPFRYRRMKQILNEPCFSGDRYGHKYGTVLGVYIFSGTLRCAGRHDWDGCVCKRCRQTRHDWDGIIGITVPGHNTCEEITTTTPALVCRNRGERQRI